MHAPVLARSLSLTALLSSPLLAQLTVGPPGSGATYPEITAALAVAQPGDTIVVAPGVYAPFELTSGVSVIGAGGDVCQVAIPAGSANGAVTIAGVPAGQTARVVGIGVDWSTSSDAARLSVTQCAGRVEVVDFVSLGVLYPTPSYVSHAVVEITDCTAVLLDGCRVNGNPASSSAYWNGGSDAVDVTASAVWIRGCTLRGAYGAENVGASALLVKNGSQVLVAGSVMEGGGGGAHIGFYSWDIYSFSGGDAVHVYDGELVIAGGPGNRVEGGMGFDLSQPYGMSYGGCAVRLFNASTLRYAADALLFEGLAGDGSPGIGPAVVTYGAPATTVVAEALRRPTLAVEPALAHPGDVVAVRTSGEPSALHVTFAAFDGVVPIAVPGAQHVHLDLAAMALLAIQPLDPAGEALLPVSLPASPVLVGVHLILQAIDLDLSTIRLSNPALFAIAQ